MWLCSTAIHKPHCTESPARLEWCYRRHHHAYYITREQNTGKTVSTVHSLKKGKGRSVLSSHPSLYSRGQVENWQNGATKPGLVFKTTAFEVLVFVISFIAKGLPSGIFAVLLRFVCTRWSHSKQIECPHHFTNYSLLEKKINFLFPCCLLVQISMLMTSEYPTVHSDEYVTSFCLCWGLEEPRKKARFSNCTNCTICVSNINSRNS